MLEDILFPQEVAKQIAEQEKKKRKQKKITQKELSLRTGVGLSSLKRFEQTGEISFVSLIKIADVLDERDMFLKLFTRRSYQSIEEVIDEWN